MTYVIQVYSAPGETPGQQEADTLAGLTALRDTGVYCRIAQADNLNAPDPLTNINWWCNYKVCLP